MKKKCNNKDCQECISTLIDKNETLRDFEKQISPNVDDVILDPIYGAIKINNDIKELIDSAAFQRLRYIKQLGLTDLVYPGAGHTRFSHSIGVWYLSRILLDKLYKKNKNIDPILGKLFLYSTILHDVGHFPFSHVLEDTFLNKDGEDKEKNNHENQTKSIVFNSGPNGLYFILKNKLYLDEEYITIIADFAVNRDQSDAAIIKTFNKIKKTVSEKTIHEFIQLKHIFHEILDRMDYLLRDSYYCGVKYGDFDFERLLNSINFNCVDTINKTKYGISTKGIEPLFSLYLARSQMFKIVYHHKAVRAIHCMLREAFSLYPQQNIVDKNKINSFTDTNLIYKLYNEKDEYILDIKPNLHLIEVFKKFYEEDSENAKMIFLIYCILKRKLYKRIITFKPFDFINDIPSAENYDKGIEMLEKLKSKSELLKKFKDEYSNLIIKDLKILIRKYKIDIKGEILLQIKDIIIMFDFPSVTDNMPFRNVYLYSDEYNENHNKFTNEQFNVMTTKLYSWQKAFRVFILNIFDLINNKNEEEKLIKKYRKLWNDCKNKKSEFNVIPKAINL